MVLTNDRIIARAVSAQHPELWNKHVSACQREFRLTQLTELIQVIKGQREEAELPEIQYGWFDLFCHEDDGHSDCFQGTIEGFAAKLLKGGWTVYDLDRNKATCYACANYDPPIDEEDERMDALVYQYRKGEQG